MQTETERALLAAGWVPGRHVTVDEDLHALATNGYPVWPALETFLATYTGLKLTIIRDGDTDTAWFSAMRACNWFGKEWAESYAARAGSKMVPVGYAYSDHLAILAAVDGRFFGGYDDFLELLGNTVDEALDNLIAVRGQAVQMDPERD